MADKNSENSRIIKFPVKKEREVTADILDKHGPREAWLVFRMDVYIAEKPADIVFLMDVGSRFIFGQIIAADEVPPYSEAEKLFDKAYKMQESWPEILYCPQNDPARELFNRLALRAGMYFETAPAQVFYKITVPVINAFRNFPPPAGGNGEEEWTEPNEEELEALSLVPDTYDPCPCGSGKKFKFCCKPAYPDIIEAMALAEEGKTGKALKFMDEARKKIGETPEILCRYAIVYSFSDKKKSDEYRNRCLELNPDHPRANYILGIDLKEKRKYREALEAYMRAVKNYPSGDRFHLNEVWNNIGTVYYELGEFKKARAAWEKAVDYMPSDKLSKDNLKLLDDTERDMAGINFPPPDYMDEEESVVKSSAFKAEIEEILKDRDFSSIKEMNEFLMKYSMEKNRTPRKEFGGLSPEMMAALLCEAAGSPKSPVKFSDNIKDKKLKTSLFFLDAKKILELFSELPPVKMTVSKNLNRKFVSKVLEISEYIKKKEPWLFEKKAVNEQDFWWLHIMRIVLEFAGLITRRKGAFHITKKGKQCLEQPGIELYKLLFKTFFYKFNLDYLFPYGPEVPHIQNAVNFSLFMAREHCGDWMKPEDFSKKVIIDGLRLNKRIKWDSGCWTLEDAYEARFISPMVNFGLFDTKKIKGKGTLDEYLIRRSPLLKEFINFSF